MTIRSMAPVHAMAEREPAWLDRTLYPFTPRTFRTSEGTLSYLDEGTGPVVLFVHGTPSWSFEWRRVITALSRTHRCIAPDHLGFGLSDKPSHAALAPEAHARRLAALVTALDLRDVTLVVHDFGGPIGLPLVFEHGERIARVLVLNSWMWPNGAEPAMRKLDRVVRSVIGRVLYRWLNVSPRMLLPAAFGDRSKLTREVHGQYVKPFAHRSEREGPYALACALVGSDAHYARLWSRRETLARKPLSIVWGLRDPAFTVRHLQRWREAFPDATVRELAGCGHFVAEECPEAVIEAIVAGDARV